MQTVLFACVHNAGRSRLAEAWFNRLADPARVRAISAGTQPADSVHPEVVRVLEQEGMADTLAAPRLLTPDLIREASLVVTMGCGESCPVIVGQERDDWPVPDPKGRPLAEVEAISRSVRERVEDLLARRGWARPAG